MGRPVITTDAPGCRDTVEHSVNGVLVPVGDAFSLQLAMRAFLENPSSVVKMGQQSRRLAVEKYDVRKVNKQILVAMGLA